MKKTVLLLLAIISLLACQKSPQENFIATDISSSQMETYFKLRDYDGHLKTIDDFKGKVVVLFFGFTHCPDICPTTMVQLKKTMTLLKDKSTSVQVVFITLDPIRDNEVVLKKFIPSFHPSFIGLTGSEADIKKTAAQFKIFYEKVDNGSKSGYTIDHSAGLYVIDKAGKMKLHINYEEKPEDIATDLAKLI